VIKFSCDNCGQKFNVPESQAGKKGRCPKCRQVVIVAGTDDGSSFTDKNGLEANKKVSGIDSSLFYIPQKTETTEKSIAERQMPVESFESFQEPSESMDLGQKPPEEKTLSKLPWFIDIFLYPFSLAGIIRLISLWLLIFLLCPLVMARVGLGTEYAPIVYFLPVSYVLYYFTECIRYSASGHFRAPDFWMHQTDSDKWDFVSQLFVVAGSIAVCFCPVAIYYIATERSDLVYWLLFIYGGFFFPMVLLAVVLFDSFNALNPLLIVRSISGTFIPYCGLIIILFVGSYICLKINSRFYSFRPLPILPFFLRAIQLYMIFIVIGLLGRFYYKYMKKLNWEV
jgi:DNA-directed RNA polymerase subunit RPC12/RpoP